MHSEVRVGESSVGTRDDPVLELAPSPYQVKQQPT